MVKPTFENLDIDFWMRPDKLGQSQPSLCVFHPSKEVGDQILAAFDELNAEGCPSRRTITFRPTKRIQSIRTLRLLFVAENDDLRVINIAYETGVATIQATQVGLPLLCEAVSKWLHGLEDFCVSSRGSKLRPRDLGQLDRASGELSFWGPGYGGP